MSSNLDIAKKYAKALFKTTHQEKFVDRISKDLKILQIVLTKTPGIFLYIKSPIHTQIVRDQFIEQICKKLKLHTYTTNFLKVIARNSRVSILESVIEQYWQLCHEANNEKLIEVISVKKLTKSQVNAIQTFFENKLQKKVLVANTEDCSILGGLIIKLDSLVIDNSVSNKLNNIKLLMAYQG